MKNLEVEKTIYHHNGEQDSGWSFWENYRSLEKNKGGNNDKSYEDNLAKLCTFNNLKDFAEFWHNYYYDDSANLLHSTLDETEKKIMRNEKQFIIECLNLFREGIKPAWEDPVNANGYDLRVELDVNQEKNSKEAIADSYKKLWQDLVFSVIGEECVFAKEITGLRYKFQPNRTAIRIEIWVKAKGPDMKSCPGASEQLQGGNFMDLTDESLKIYWGIRMWIEDTIKSVRKNQQTLLQVQYTSHCGK